MNDHPHISKLSTVRNAAGLMRAAWMAQELLTTFESELGGITLVPGSGGVFEFRIDGLAIWSRAERRRFPEMKELKQLVRDRVAPGKSLGHSDHPQVPDE